MQASIATVILSILVPMNEEKTWFNKIHKDRKPSMK